MTDTFCYASIIPHGAGAGIAWRHMSPPLCFEKGGGNVEPEEIRNEIKAILDKFCDEDIRLVLRLVELTVRYNRIMKL